MFYSLTCQEKHFVFKLYLSLFFKLFQLIHSNFLNSVVTWTLWVSAVSGSFTLCVLCRTKPEFMLLMLFITHTFHASHTDYSQTEAPDERQRHDAVRNLWQNLWSGRPESRRWVRTQTWRKTEDKKSLWLFVSMKIYSN